MAPHRLPWRRLRCGAVLAFARLVDLVGALARPPAAGAGAVPGGVQRLTTWCRAAVANAPARGRLGAPRGADPDPEGRDRGQGEGLLLLLFGDSIWRWLIE